MAGVDALVITALKEEYEAARQAGAVGYADNPGVESWDDRGIETPTPYVFGEYRLSGGRSMTVALARPTRMGSTATAPVVSSLVEQLKPGCLAMCGVCAGNPRAVAMGDVVIAETAYVYDEGKRTPDSFRGDHRQIPMSDGWVRAAQDLDVEDLPSFDHVSDKGAAIWLLERLYAGDDPRESPGRSRYLGSNAWAKQVQHLQSIGYVLRDGRNLTLTDKGIAYIEEVVYDDVSGPDTLPFQVVVGPMASGNVVVGDGLTWDLLAQQGVRSVVGLEMEAAVVANTAHRLGVPEWIVAKGVMDFADPRKDDRYKAFAARSSAEVLYKFLGQRLGTPRDRTVARTSRLRTVYVIGGVTEETEYPDYESAELARFCNQLGDSIARAGADLVICSPFPDSADFHALMGYLQSGVGRVVNMHRPRHALVDENEVELRKLVGPEASRRLKTWHYPAPEKDDSEALSQAWLLCQLMALDQADVVVSVGGRLTNTASTILHLAEARKKIIVPFEFLGGASQRAFRRRNWEEVYPGLAFGGLKGKDATVAMKLADDMAIGAMGRVRGYGWPPRRVFVSRARPDAAFAQALAEYLTELGLNVLLGDKEFSPRRTVEAAIEDAVLRADLFIVLWSKSYAASRYCFDEINLALQRHRAGETQLWIINLDESDIVPPDARNLPQATARTPNQLVMLVRELLEYVKSNGNDAA